MAIDHVPTLGVSLLTVTHCIAYSLHYNKSHLTHCIAHKRSSWLSHYSLHLAHFQLHFRIHCHLEPFTAADRGSLSHSQPFTAANQGHLLSYWLYWKFNFLNDFKRLPGASAVNSRRLCSGEVVQIFVNCFKRLEALVHPPRLYAKELGQCYNITSVGTEPSGTSSVLNSGITVIRTFPAVALVWWAICLVLPFPSLPLLFL